MEFASPLIISIAITLVLGIPSDRAQKDRQEEAAVLIDRLGGQIKRNSDDPKTPIIAVSFNGVNSTIEDKHLPELVRALSELGDLRTVGIHYTGITEAGLKDIARLGQLRTLKLGNN